MECTVRYGCAVAFKSSEWSTFRIFLDIWCPPCLQDWHGQLPPLAHFASIHPLPLMLEFLFVLPETLLPMAHRLPALTTSGCQDNSLCSTLPLPLLRTTYYHWGCILLFSGHPCTSYMVREVSGNDNHPYYASYIFFPILETCKGLWMSINIFHLFLVQPWNPINPYNL